MEGNGVDYEIIDVSDPPGAALGGNKLLTLALQPGKSWGSAGDQLSVAEVGCKGAGQVRNHSDV